MHTVHLPMTFLAVLFLLLMTEEGTANFSSSCKLVGASIGASSTNDVYLWLSPLDVQLLLRLCRCGQRVGSYHASCGLSRKHQWHLLNVLLPAPQMTDVWLVYGELWDLALCWLQWLLLSSVVSGLDAEG